MSAQNEENLKLFYRFNYQMLLNNYLFFSDYSTEPCKSIVSSKFHVRLFTILFSPYITQLMKVMLHRISCTL